MDDKLKLQFLVSFDIVNAKSLLIVLLYLFCLLIFDNLLNDLIIMEDSNASQASKYKILLPANQALLSLRNS